MHRSISNWNFSTTVVCHKYKHRIITASSSKSTVITEKNKWKRARKKIKHAYLKTLYRGWTTNHFKEARVQHCGHQNCFTNVWHASSEYIKWQWRNFVPYLCHLVFAAILLVKLWKMLVTVIALKHALLVSQWSYGHFRKLTGSILCE